MAVPLRKPEIRRSGQTLRTGPLTPDEAVQSTNDDASYCKLSAVQLGLYEDDVLPHFVESQERRQPLISLGYFSRVSCVRKIVERFMQTEYKVDGEEKKKQIVCLGAGFDTLFFHLQKKGMTPGLHVELDFPAIVSHKIRRIKDSPFVLDRLFPGVSSEDAIASITEQSPTLSEIHAGPYHLLSVDLRVISDFAATLERCGFDKTAPTLVLSECVLIYMDPSESAQLIQWFSDTCDAAVFVVYEQIRPNDPFGQVMVRNLEQRGSPLKGLRVYPDIESQKQRFLDLKWNRVECYDMYYLHENFIDMEARRRAQRIQMLDEIEEWRMIQEHHCIIWAHLFKEHAPQTFVNSFFIQPPSA